MKKRSIAKAKRRRKMNPIVKILLAIALVYVGGTMVVTCIKLQGQISEKQAELEATNQQIAVQRIEKEQLNAELNNVLNGVVDKEYLEHVEKIARDRNFVYPGETLYENITDE